MNASRLLHAVLLATTTGALTAACGADPTNLGHESQVVVTQEGGVLLLANGYTDDRWFIVVEKETAALLDLNLDPEASESWTRVPAGATRPLPLEKITGYHPAARSVIVYSWIRSVATPVNGGVQWTGEGFTWTEVPLR